MLKDLVKLDATTKDSDLSFSKQMASVLNKNIDNALNSRAVWILLELLEHENTAKYVSKELASHLK